MIKELSDREVELVSGGFFLGSGGLGGFTLNLGGLNLGGLQLSNDAFGFGTAISGVFSSIFGRR